MPKFTISIDVLFERVQSRAMEERPITREEIERWVAFIQVPDDKEMKLFDQALTLGECPTS